MVNLNGLPRSREESNWEPSDSSVPGLRDKMIYEIDVSLHIDRIIAHKQCTHQCNGQSPPFRWEEDRALPPELPR